jgi:phage host-nuclease inhibitor protein Gam
MVKQPAKKKVTQQAYQTALEAYKNDEIAARALAVKREKEVARIDDKYNPLFEEYIETQKARFDIIQQYCEDNRDTLFEGKQIIKSNGIDYGFRKGKFKVCPLEGETDESTLAGVKKYLPDYIRTKEEIAQDKLLSDKDAIPAKDLKKAGLCFEQDEKFFVKVAETKK